MKSLTHRLGDATQRKREKNNIQIRNVTPKNKETYFKTKKRNMKIIFTVTKQRNMSTKTERHDKKRKNT